MAPSLGDKVYLPDLEPCLKGETVILSWRLLASALSDATGHRQSNEAVIEFLSNAQVQTFFTKPATVFEPQGAGGNDPYKQAFETRTSAIQVTPTPNDKYDVKTIKEDSLWLSKNARINLLAALRVVVVEFQSRPRSQLMGPISRQDVTNLQEAAGATQAQTNNVFSGLILSSTRDASDIDADFAKPEARRKRVFQTYLEERRYFAMVTDHIFTLMLQERLPACPSSAASAKIRSSFLNAFGLTSQTPQSEAPTKTYHALVSTYFALLTSSIRSCDDFATIVEDQGLQSEILQREWMTTFFIEAIHAMTVAFQLLDLSTQVLVSPELLQQWFNFVGDNAFLDQAAAAAGLDELVPPIQCLMSAVSLVILNIRRVLRYFEGEVDLDSNAEYLGSSDALNLVHIVVQAVADRNIAWAMPVLFAWVPILHGMTSSYQERAERRDAIQNQKAVEAYDSGTQMIPGAGRRNSAGSITTIDKTGYDDFLTGNQLERDTQPVRILGEIATNHGSVYDNISAMAGCLGSSENAIFTASVGSRIRLVFLELLKITYSYVGYKSEPVGALLFLLSDGQKCWDPKPAYTLLPTQDVVCHALKDQFTLRNFFDQALNRFPYEFIPFTTLCRLLSCATNADAAGDDYDLVPRLLQRTPTLTFELPDYFNDYELANEEDNSNTIRFVEELPLFEVKGDRRRISMDEDNFVIAAGTIGRFVVDAGRIVQIEYEYSALSLLGKRLETNLLPDVYQAVLGSLGPEETAETISLLSTLIRTENLKASSTLARGEVSDAGLAILAEASRALPRTKDIISVVCDTLDSYAEKDPDGATLLVLTSCVQFLNDALPLCPGRIWSYMARCSLLSNSSRGGRLLKLVGTLELSVGQFELIMTTVHLFSDLVENAVSSSVQRRATSKSTSRRKSNENVWIGVSDKIINQITESIAHIVVDVFESSSTWRFSDVQQTALVRDLVTIMNKLIVYTFSMDDRTVAKPLTSPLEIAAKYIIDSFLAPSAGSLRVQPLLNTLVLAIQWPDTTIYASRLRALCDRTNAVLNLATTLVRVANHFDRSSTTIELQLFKATPFVARVCAVSNLFRASCISLLEALVVSAGKTVGEPPSLLGYLGPRTSRAFLQLLSTLDRPFNQSEDVCAIWRFFSIIVRNRQQWMANCLLTGKTPREARNGHDKAFQASSDSILMSGMTRISSISSIPTPEALAILDFITSAQNYWPWVIFNLQRNTEFVSGLRAYVSSLKPSSVTARSNPMQACSEARIAAFIAETFAMQLFHLRQLGQADSLAKDLTQELDYFLREGVLVSGYNNSLHANFARNFGIQYPGCTLDNFKRTLLEPRSLGTDYYYAVTLAGKILSFDSGWIGPRDNGFKHEMEMANTNLSLVDAQIALFHAWEFLLLELSNCLPQNATLKKQSLQVAEQCLEANEATHGHEQIFERLTEARVDLALVLVQRVVDNAPSAGDIAQLLKTLWATISSIEEPYITDNVPLYRTLLKLLYVLLRAQGKASDEKRPGYIANAAVSQTVLSILDRTVAKGFRTLVSLIHETTAASSVLPQDIAILTAIMQACLCIPGISQSQTQVMNIMAAHDAVHVAVSLYSWSDKLADKGDPVYGELSLLFLLELSTLPLVAEQLACDGLLNHLTSASLATYLNRPNVGPFADTIGPQRCYSIWAKAVLPLLLNILKALGPTIAPEVAYVLNQFPTLLASSTERLEAPGGSRTNSRSRSAHITLLSVSEIYALALMTRILAALRVNDTRIPDVEWDSAGVLENVEFWLGTRKILRERLIPTEPREVEWKAMEASPQGIGRGCESQLEEKVANQLEVVRAVLSEDLE